VVETAAAQMQDRLQEIMGIRAKMIPSTSPVVEVSIVEVYWTTHVYSQQAPKTGALRLWTLK